MEERRKSRFEEKEGRRGGKVGLSIEGREERRKSRFEEKEGRRGGKVGLSIEGRE